ncbi:MAG TPA: hypothetical protein VGD69_17765 [Herpetosiphonaceae bacterium]
MGKKQKPSQQRRGGVPGGGLPARPSKQPYGNGKGTVLQRRPPRHQGR